MPGDDSGVCFMKVGPEPADTRPPSRGGRRPRFAYRCPSQMREQGMPDARCTRGPVCKLGKKAAHEHTGQRRTSDIPCAMALRLITRSPRRIRAFVASVASRKPAPRPGRAFSTSARLDANHRGVGSTRFCRTLRHRSFARPEDRSRSLSRPAISSRARCRRVHRIPSQRSVTMANAPSSGTGWRDS